MKRSIRILMTLSLAAVLAGSDIAVAGRKPGTGGTTTGKVMASPASVSSPVTSIAPINVCVSGFSQGNYVNVNVPLTGDPVLHSWLSYSAYVGTTGGFCFAAPPAGRTLNLKPGAYMITVYWSASGSSGSLKPGPTTTFTVKI